MLKSIEKALRLSEIREALNGLNAIAEQTDAQKTEETGLIGQLKTTETEYRAALTSESDEHATVPVNGEDREYVALLGRGNVGPHPDRVCRASVRPTGPTRSYNQHRGLNQATRFRSTCCVCRSSIAPSRPDRTNVGTTEQPAIMPVFARGIGAFIFADRPDGRRGHGGLSGARPAADRRRVRIPTPRRSKKRPDRFRVSC